MTAKPASKTQTPEAQLKAFIARLEPGEQRLFRSARASLRKQFPTANEFAYDYGHSVVIAYSPTDHGKDGIVTIATRDGGVRLYFGKGPRLRDPKKLLQGKATQTRYIALDTASRLAHPDVKALIAGAVAQATVPFASKGKGKLFIRGAAAK